jgi:hypothetical protein
MREGRYRKNWLTTAECTTWAENFAEPLQKILWHRQESSWSPAEFVAAYLESGFRSAGRLVKGSHWQPSPAQRVHEGPLSFWSQVLIRGLPVAVNRALLNWHHGIFPLHLCEHIPDTEEVLRWQTQGERCVTCVTQKELLNGYILDERDPLSFVVHDLIHADHFFRDPLMAQTQIGFARVMQLLLAQPLLRKLRQSDPTFRSEFDYGSTDMNSHGAHLLKYLKAILVFALERQGSSAISPQLEELFENIGWPEKTRRHFLELNTAAENTETLQHLQTDLLERGRP